MSYTLSVLAENHSGVLSKVVGLFSRRGYNIRSLSVGETEDSSISRMTIVVDGDRHTVEQIDKQLNKVIPVIKVRILGEGSYHARELTLIKVACNSSQRPEIMKIAEVMNARIIDVGKNSITIEFTDTPEEPKIF